MPSSKPPRKLGPIELATALASPGNLASAITLGMWRWAPHLELLSKKLRAAAYTPNSRLIVSMPPRHGKELSDDTPVPTPNGFVCHGSLKPGDEVFGLHGQPVRVLAVTEPEVADAFEVRFDFGVLVAHQSHEWLVESDCERCACGGGPSRHRHREVLETRGLLKRKRAEAVPVAGAWQLPEATLPIDPYLFGVWLGDGHSRAGAVTVGAEKARHFEHLADKVTVAGQRYRPEQYRLVFRGMVSKLRELGVYRNKRIPQCYLFASERQRLALLQGLMDTDGYAAVGGQCEFCSVRDGLAQDVLALASSLGLKAGISVGDATINRRFISKKYRVLFTPPPGFQVFLLKRKQDRLYGQRRPRAGHRYVRAVTPVGKRSMRCIQVEGGVYLAGRESIPTHNSELVSKWFPVWLLVAYQRLAARKHYRVVLVSYADDFAGDFGGNVRDIINENAKTFGLMVKGDTSAKNHWRTTNGGDMRAVGIAGQITGMGADMLIVDDPVKDWEEANSETMLAKQWGQYRSTLYSRLEPGGSVVVVMTRWHSNDLVGMIQREMADGGEVYEEIRLPAIAEENDIIGRKEGEALWPERFPLERLNVIKHTVDPKHKLIVTPSIWAGLYQQRPAPAEGGMIKRHWWRRYSELPPPRPGKPTWDKLVQSWDCAFKNLKDSDYVVGQLWGMRGADLYLLDVVRGQMDFPETIAAVKKLSTRWPGALAKLIEDTANGPAVISTLAHEVPGLIPFKTRGKSKTDRASAASPLAEAGNVFIPEGIVGDTFIDEAASFPHGTNDDQVDAWSQAVLFLMPAIWRNIDLTKAEAERKGPQSVAEIQKQARAKAIERYFKRNTPTPISTQRRLTRGH